jgi:hypothetical protein
MLSVKKMIDLYVSYELDETTWNMLYNMVNHGLISSENWEKFYTTCKGWSFEENGQTIEDENGKVIYRRNENGYLVKVK